MDDGIPFKGESCTWIGLRPSIRMKARPISGDESPRGKNPEDIGGTLPDTHERSPWKEETSLKTRST